jgi:hypothetical protein
MPYTYTPVTDAYGSVVDASAYLVEYKLDYQAVWNATSLVQQTVAYNQAVRLVESLIFAGEKTDPVQLLDFPRDGLTDVPENIVRAVYEIAFALIAGKDTQLEADTRSVVQTRGPLGNQTINPRYLTDARRHNIPSEVAWQYLCPFLRDVRSPVIERLS